MKTLPRMLALSAVVLATLSGALSANAADDSDVWCTARISLDASGKVTALDFDRKDDSDVAIANKLAPAIRSWAFVPGSVNGVPAPTETTLALHLHSEPSGGGNHVLRVLEARTGGFLPGGRPPAYPHEALAGGAQARIVAMVSVDPDGVPTKVDFAGIRMSPGSGVSSKVFKTAVTQAEMTMRARPEIVGGHPIAAQFKVQVEYCLGAASSCVRGTEVDAMGQPTQMDQVDQLDSQVKLTTQVVGMAL